MLMRQGMEPVPERDQALLTDAVLVEVLQLSRPPQKHKKICSMNKKPCYKNDSKLLI